MRILLVEDDDCIAKTIETVLVKESYVVDVAIDGEAGWRLVETFAYDLILLDVLLPKMDGLTLCRQLRSHNFQTPILLITSQNSSSDRVEGLDAGADDYLAKPFEVPELLARIRVLLRRSSCPVAPLLEWEYLRLNPDSREVTYREHPLHLTPKEYRLLELFLRNPHHVFSRNRILEHLWNCEETPGEDTVTAHIKGLRQKLKKAGAPSQLIETVYGVGYRLKRFAASSSVVTAGRSNPPQQTVIAKNGAEKPPQLSADSLALPSHNQEKFQGALKARQTQVALNNLWEKFKERNRDRLRVLERAIDAWRQNRLDDELHQQGQWAAHKLAGALGIFGLTQGSYLALELEKNFKQRLALNPQQLSHLVELLAGLESIIQQGPPNRTGQLFTSKGCPLLLVDGDSDLIKQLIQASQLQQMQIKRIVNLQSAQQEIALHAAPQNAVTLSPTSLPDALILEFSTASTTPESFTQLADLTQKFPHMPVLLVSDRASLDLRLQLTKAGIRAILPKLPPAPMLEMISQMQFQSGVSMPKTPRKLLPARVLVVDDDPQVLMVMRTLLEPWGLQLTTLEHPPQFWDTLESVAPDLLILDVEMPQFNGIELCQVVRNAPRWSQLPILFLTVHTDANTLRQVLMAGANDLIGKPIAEFEVVGRILPSIRTAAPVTELYKTRSLRIGNSFRTIQIPDFF
ncbi:response regulator [Kovacikia minuta CCNUW1]|uniref:response regulator n=1 Tax=Kovacikia minuta TaxID=2931930 RepID=UPI001CCD3D47|nr:response regulator [Kovacikia minuta]UBF24304.1 response regulator [Kovacikia minuta CCNUW1]